MSGYESADAVLDALLAAEGIAPPTFAGKPTERKCRRHRWVRVALLHGPGVDGLTFTEECACGAIKDATRSRRGRTSRSYGNRAELSAARRYGGTKIGHAGGPVDIRGTDFATQVKTHRRLPPVEWRKAFGAMAQDNRCPRLLLRFVQGPGLPPVDYFVFPADDWLDWFGRDDAA